MLKIKYKLNIYKKKYTCIKESVLKIINDIKKYGDKALIFYIKKIDGLIINLKNILINKNKMKIIFNNNSIFKKKIIKEIFIRLKKYHFNYINNSWQIEKNYIIYGQIIKPIDKICVYVPGGNNIYPSSVLMNIIPSLIYKPKKIYLVTPINLGKLSKTIISISYICCVDKMILSGGVHTLSCVVYGTKKIKNVNKIVGPGNFFITESKKIFFGVVGIDMLAGPSELIILCKSNIHPKIIIYDFYSQLEHDVSASTYLISNNKKYLNTLYKYIYNELKSQFNKKIIFNSLKNSKLLLLNLLDAIQLINYLSPEHLMLCFNASEKILSKIKNSGTIFINYTTSISSGDYFVGPSHVIPTNKNSKFSSSLNINDFCKKINIIKIFKNNYSKNFVSYLSKKEKFLCHGISNYIR